MLQEFYESISKRLDKEFEGDVNALLNSARTFNHDMTTRLGGRLDAVSATSAIIKEVYNSFIKGDNNSDDNTRTLY